MTKRQGRRFYWVRFPGAPDWVPAARTEGDEFNWSVPGSDTCLSRCDFAEMGPELIPPAASSHRDKEHTGHGFAGKVSKPPARKVSKPGR